MGVITIRLILLIILLVIIMSCNSYAYTIVIDMPAGSHQNITADRITKLNIQPYLFTYLNKIILTDKRYIFIDSNGLTRSAIATTVFNNITIYNNTDIAYFDDRQLENVMRHEIGHIVARQNYGIYSEDTANRFVIASKFAANDYMLKLLMGWKIGYMIGG